MINGTPRSMGFNDYSWEYCVTTLMKQADVAEKKSLDKRYSKAKRDYWEGLFRGLLLAAALIRGTGLVQGSVTCKRKGAGK